MVTITGMGAVSAVGLGVESYGRAVFEGRSGIRRVEGVASPSHQAPLGGVVDGLERPAAVDEVRWRRWDRAVAMAVISALEAIGEAGLGPGLMGDRPWALLVGTSLGGVLSGMAYQRALHEGRLEDETEGLCQAPLHAVADEVAAVLGMHGPRITISNACVSGANCVGYALDLLRDGRVEGAVCLGVDTFHAFTLTGFGSMWALAQDAMRPFDAARTGMLLGEAAAAVVIESDARCARGEAQAIARLAGYGIGGDAVHVSAPDRTGGGLTRAMTMALADAGIAPSDVDWINANATGSRYGDASEAAAIRAVFGDLAATVPVSTVKPITGHTLGAAGILEVIASVLAIRRGAIPPNVGLAEAAPDCDLGGLVLGRTVERSVTTVLSNSAGFGGATACLVVRGR